jgi:hypothetical protein
MPDADLSVLLYCKNWDDPICTGYWDGEFWNREWNDRAFLGSYIPTHWMDFPEPPEEAK